MRLFYIFLALLFSLFIMQGVPAADITAIKITDGFVEPLFAGAAALR